MGQFGFVQIAVEAYIYQLVHLREGGSSLFAKELILQEVAKPTHFYQKVVPADGCFTASHDSGMVLLPPPLFLQDKCSLGVKFETLPRTISIKLCCYLKHIQKNVL